MTSPPSEASPACRGESYWTESRRPWPSLVFIAPLLVTYEVGVLVLGRHAARNGVDVWLRQILDALGFSQYFLLPALTVCILLGWHYLTRQSWRISRGVLYGMTIECVLLAFCLRIVLYLQSSFLHALAGTVCLSIADAAGTLVGYLGAGIYEELLFRLVLLLLVVGVLRWARLSSRSSMIGGVLATSLLFATAHYVGPDGDSFVWFSFIFRTLAGVFFSLLFLYRGFGVAAGAHAGYDVLLGVSRLSIGV
jgi:membrane protease YdiL (CAAX protease family)